MARVNVVKDTDKQALRDEYQSAMDTLTQIRDANSLTQAQAVQAVKHMAKILLFLVKLYARTL